MIAVNVEQGMKELDFRITNSTNDRKQATINEGLNYFKSFPGFFKCLKSPRFKFDHFWLKTLLPWSKDSKVLILNLCMHRICSALSSWNQLAMMKLIYHSHYIARKREISKSKMWKREHLNRVDNRDDDVSVEWLSLYIFSAFTFWWCHSNFISLSACMHEVMFNVNFLPH